MGAALGVLRWSPETFWRATPRELAAALEGRGGRRPLAPPTLHDLARLMRVFPDALPS
jgi:uncharacterized phage protein (TIGR02216 family)